MPANKRQNHHPHLTLLSASTNGVLVASTPVLRLQRQYGNVEQCVRKAQLHARSAAKQR